MIGNQKKKKKPKSKRKQRFQFDLFIFDEFHFAEDTLNHLQNIRESVVQMKNDRDMGIGGYRFRQLNKSNQKLRQQSHQMVSVMNSWTEQPDLQLNIISF